jgi:hypothetical protein
MDQPFASCSVREKPLKAAEIDIVASAIGAHQIRVDLMAVVLSATLALGIFINFLPAAPPIMRNGSAAE